MKLNISKKLKFKIFAGIIGFCALSPFNIASAEQYSPETVAAFAHSYIGTSRDIYDCSAFTQKVFSDLGIKIPRVSYDQAKCGKKIPSANIDDLKPGDIICMGSSDDPSDISHVGIYYGNDIMLHSSYSQHKIIETSLTKWISEDGYGTPYQYAIRIIKDDNTKKPLISSSIFPKLNEVVRNVSLY